MFNEAETNVAQNFAIDLAEQKFYFSRLLANLILSWSLFETSDTSSLLIAITGITYAPQCVMNGITNKLTQSRQQTHTLKK